MIARCLLLLTAFAVPVAFAQMGLYGPVTTRVKAGDAAPDITISRTLSAPVAASWSQSNLSGQLTVLAFFPNTTLNLQSVTMWNELVDKLAGKPVQFVWITGEDEATLVPWVEQHPMRGWVLLDREGKTGSAYGMEEPANVLIGADRKVIGFFPGIMEVERLVKAVQEGRVTTVRPDKATIQEFIASNRVHIDAEPPRMMRPEDHKPHFVPSYAVHVSVSKGDARGNSSAPDYWELKGFTFPEAVQEIYGLNSARIRVPAALDTKTRYDFAMVLPEPESHEKMQERMQQGLLEHFHLTAKREGRLVDTYVVTSSEPKMVMIEAKRGMGGGSSDVSFVSSGEPGEEDGLGPHKLEAIDGIGFEGTVDDFCHELENMLDRPVVNETKREGEYAIDVRSGEKKNEFLDHLRAQTGMVITPGERNVEMLVFEER